jgi:hypothetical protein
MFLSFDFRQCKGMKYFFCFQITFDVYPYVFRRLPVSDTYLPLTQINKGSNTAMDAAP